MDKTRHKWIWQQPITGQRQCTVCRLVLPIAHVAVPPCPYTPPTDEGLREQIAEVIKATWADGGIGADASADSILSIIKEAGYAKLESAEGKFHLELLEAKKHITHSLPPLKVWD